MAEKRKTTASKTTSRATANRNGSSQSGKKKAAAAAAGAAAAVAVTRKVNAKTLLIALSALVISFAIGVGLCFLLSKNDKFDLVGGDELSFTIGETYKDEGVDIKEFGINMSGRATVETNLLLSDDGEYYATEPGTYYMSYTVGSLKFGLVYKVRKVRLVTFVEISESMEVEE